MIVVTGAAGFIGSCLVAALNAAGYRHVVAVDRFGLPAKLHNLADKQLLQKVEREQFTEWLHEKHSEVEFVFHLGARTDTAEQSTELFDKLNLHYSQQVWQACTKYQIPLVYASSAATYGAGEHGYTDDEAKIDELQPLNPYGWSKQNFDQWVLQQEEQPFFWAGLKFFNVYGPNEYHKSRMASVVFHAFNQIQETGKMMLFRSHNPDYMDGHQQRDFVYVKDVVNVLLHLMHTRKGSGIYNLGSGTARTFLDLTKAVFKELSLDENIGFRDTPADIRATYQYYTQAEMQKLREQTGYATPFTSLEDGIADYVQRYLKEQKVW